jgi:hypothetical protein
MTYYPFNKELRFRRKEESPKNSAIFKEVIEDKTYLLEIDLDLLPKELTEKQKLNFAKSIYRILIY